MTDGAGSVIREGGDYEDGVLVRDTFQLASGCYRFIIYDESVGIGLTPAFYPGIFPNSSNGNFTLRDDKSKTIISATASNLIAQFGDKYITTFSVGGASSVSAAKDDIHFELYPNPSRGDVTIGLGSSITEPLDVLVFDLLGNEVYIGNIPAGSTTMQISSTLAEGSYIVRISSDSYKASRRLVIRK